MWCVVSQQHMLRWCFSVWCSEAAGSLRKQKPKNKTPGKTNPRYPCLLTGKHSSHSLSRKCFLFGALWKRATANNFGMTWDSCHQEKLSESLCKLCRYHLTLVLFQDCLRFCYSLVSLLLPLLSFGYQLPPFLYILSTATLCIKWHSSASIVSSVQMQRCRGICLMPAHDMSAL